MAIGAGCDFLTPIGHQCNTLVMGPGGYRFGDFVRVGIREPNRRVRDMADSRFLKLKGADMIKVTGRFGAIALGVVLAVTALDIITAVRMSTVKRNRP